MKKNKLIVLLSLFILLFLCVFIFENNNSINNRLSDGYENYNNENISPYIDQSDPAIEEWVQFWGGSQGDFGYSVIADSSDFIYVGGETYSFGSGNLDLFLVKYNKDGDEIWSVVWDGGKDEAFSALNLDSNGNFYLLGYSISGTFPNIDFDFILIKYSDSGNQLWNKRWGGDSADVPIKSILIDSNNDVYVAGYTDSYGTGSYDALLIKYDGNGNELWYKTWGDTGSDMVKAMALDSLGNVYIAGNTDSYGSDYRTFIVKYSSSGTFSWETFPWGMTNQIYDITIDSSDNIYITGYSTNYGDLLLMKYNNLGDRLWFTNWVGPNSFEVKGDKIALDSSENVCIGGRYGDNIILLKFDKNGNEKWYDIWGGIGTEYVADIMIDSTNDIFILGTTDSYGQGFSDVCLLKYNAEGELKVELFWGGINTDSCYDMIFDSSKNIYITGDTYSFGSGNADMYIVKLDNAPPQISIISPISNQIFGNNTFFFNLSIFEPNLDSSWYTLNGNLTKMFFSGTYGKINQFAWDQCGNGAVSIMFYANDTMGNTNFSEVSVLKDSSLPYIKVLSPKESSFHGANAPMFEIYLSGDDIDSTWYTVNQGENNNFLGTSGIVNSILWSNCEDGNVSLEFYVCDSTGWSSFDQVTVNKDSIPPNIIILNPTHNQLCGIKTIHFDLNITDPDLDSLWYSLNEGFNYTIIDLNGKIDQDAWDLCQNGTINITFYANDTSGNIICKEVVVRKDTSTPEITVISPISYQLFGEETINFNLSIIGLNIEERWYSLNGGINYSFSQESGIIDQNAWDSCTNGTVSIKFYANNSIGNIGIEELTIYKDILSPNISIIYPIENQMFGNSTFAFNLAIIEGNLNTTWYTLNNGSKFYFAGNSGIINKTAWDACPEGIVILKFYANDSLRNIGFNEIIIFKGILTLKTKKAYALVIGIEDYQDPTLNDLSYCEDDANEIFTYLRSGCNFLPSNIYLCLGSQATNIGIDNTFALIKSKIQPDDIFFFYFSGHGGWESGDNHFICPYNTLISDPLTYYYDDDLNNQLNQLNCAQKYVVIDACRSGGLIPENQQSGRFVMTACSSTEDSIESSQLHNGAFTYFFLRSPNYATDTNNDNVISMEEQYTYTSTQTTMYCSGVGHSQHPQRYDGIPGNNVIYPSLGSLTLTPRGKELDFSFYVYGNGYLKTLNLTLCSISPSISYTTINLAYFSPSETGFGGYSGTISPFDGNITGYEFVAEIEGYNLRTFKYSFGDSDEDGLEDLFEINIGLDPRLNDTDFDGLSDYDEYYGITDPIVDDTDGDGMLDGYEVFNGLNPLINDSLSDLDGDGLSNFIEHQLGSLANNNDTDGDELPDGWEYNNGLNLLIDDGILDHDGDGLITLLEYQIGSNFNNSDTDGDTMNDGWEYNNGLNIFADDGNLDFDDDGLTNLEEYNLGSSPILNDTDTDGMPDGYEVSYSLDPLVDDSLLDPDEDDLSNLLEFQSGTNPHLEDTDGDTWSDGDEVLKYKTDPLDPEDYPHPDNAISGYNLFLILGLFSIIAFILSRKIRKV